MISGMYMGELARLVIVKLTKEGALFRGRGSENLFKRENFFTKYISEIERWAFCWILRSIGCPRKLKFAVMCGLIPTIPWWITSYVFSVYNR